MKIKELTTKGIENIMMDKALIIMLVLMVIGTTIIEPSFLQIGVLTNILTQSAVKTICTLGLMFALLLDGANLSGGRQAGLAVVMMASLSQIADHSNKFWPGLPELPIIIPVTTTLALVAVTGVVNGSMIAKLKMAPFVVTFGISTTIYDTNCPYFAREPNNLQPIGGIRDTLTVLSSSRVFGQTFSLMAIAIIAIVGAWFLLNKTVFGKNIYIVGGSLKAVKVSGINVGRMIIAAFIIEPMFVGLVGVLEVTRIGGANPAYENAYEFNAISSCVVGGVSLDGGTGKVSDVIIGVLIFTFISYELTYIGVNSNWQLTVKGFIICSAVALDVRKNS